MQNRFTNSTCAVEPVDWADALAWCRDVARRYSRCPHLADDAAQEAVVRAWRATDRHAEVRDPHGWLATIARREVLRLGARQRSLTGVPLDDRDQALADDPLDDVDRRASMAAAIARLPERDRELLHLRYVEDLTQAGVAERLDVPEGTVKVQLHRARARLRSLLEEDR